MVDHENDGNNMKSVEDGEEWVGSAEQRQDLENCAINLILSSTTISCLAKYICIDFEYIMMCNFQPTTPMIIIIFEQMNVQWDVGKCWEIFCNFKFMETNEMSQLSVFNTLFFSPTSYRICIIFDWTIDCSTLSGVAGNEECESWSWRISIVQREFFISYQIAVIRIITQMNNNASWTMLMKRLQKLNRNRVEHDDLIGELKVFLHKTSSHFCTTWMHTSEFSVLFICWKACTVCLC